MKKVLAIIMIFATLASFGSAYAAENTSTSIQYGVESTYSVVIPESAAVDASTKKAVLNFEATAKLDVGQAVRIYLQSASPMQHYIISGYQCQYTLPSEYMYQGQSILTITHADKTKTSSMELTVTSEPPVAGLYTAQLTFYVSCTQASGYFTINDKHVRIATNYVQDYESLYGVDGITWDDYLDWYQYDTKDFSLSGEFVQYTINRDTENAKVYFLTDLKGNYITADSMLKHGNKYATTTVAPN